MQFEYKSKTWHNCQIAKLDKRSSKYQPQTLCIRYYVKATKHFLEESENSPNSFILMNRHLFSMWLMIAVFLIDWVIGNCHGIEVFSLKNILHKSSSYYAMLARGQYYWPTSQCFKSLTWVAMLTFDRNGNLFWENVRILNLSYIHMHVFINKLNDHNLYNILLLKIVLDNIKEGFHSINPKFSKRKMKVQDGLFFKQKIFTITSFYCVNRCSW